ncbi:hypothetical protein Vretimale_2860 [Volvox reticuliferus]|uniref:glycerophosphodiester phosphodiesterase n=1 Tax=Volvox reticuliferus TaxID=1737510 RepID=A0A8J4D8H9_9CHLO|nr:hypothetical protein Vretifemale_1871 [Volvox reticuliferus]GIL97116.1 hypothetical protein Vretimale_2860 [Volvox reticuliferus]
MASNRMGENLVTRSPSGKADVYPAFRENTIQSFQQAAKCGVGFVEFDVQVTRDNVPVIWHDDDVVIGPADHPSRPQVKDLTLAELKVLCGRGGEGSSSGAAADASASNPCMSGVTTGCTPRGCDDKREPVAIKVADGTQEPRGLLRLFRDRATRQWATSYEQWKCDQDDAIPTLEAVFAALPPEVGFDIEIKMTTGDDVVHTPSDEVERMLGAILPVVNRCSSSSSPSSGPVSAPPSPLPTAHLTDCGCRNGDVVTPQRRRRIMFSSFDPDVCVELRRRQTEHPVYYLSGCGLYTHADARRTSIPAALSFASEAGMRGIVVPASVLLKNMDLVESANRNHLELMTYGLENNDLDCLKAQADAGVVAAIVDEVEGVTAAFNAGNGNAAAATVGSISGSDAAIADAIATGAL